MDNNQNNPLQKFIDYFFSLNPYELSFLGSIVGTLLSIPLTNAQQDSLGNWIELVGQQMEAIQAQGALLGPKLVDYCTLNKALESINFKFEYLEELIDYLRKKQ